MVQALKLSTFKKSNFRNSPEVDIIFSLLKPEKARLKDHEKLPCDHLANTYSSQDLNSVLCGSKFRALKEVEIVSSPHTSGRIIFPNAIHFTANNPDGSTSIVCTIKSQTNEAFQSLP